MTTKKRTTKTTADPTVSDADSGSSSAVRGSDLSGLLGLFRSGMSVMDATTDLAVAMPARLLGGDARSAAGEDDAPSEGGGLRGTLAGITSSGLKSAGRGSALIDDLLGAARR